MSFKIDNHDVAGAGDPVCRFAGIDDQGPALPADVRVVCVAVDDQVVQLALDRVLGQVVRVHHADFPALQLAFVAVLVNLAAEVLDGALQQELLAVVVSEDRDEFRAAQLAECLRRERRHDVPRMQNVLYAGRAENLNRLHDVSPIVVCVRNNPNPHRCPPSECIRHCHPQQRTSRSQGIYKSIREVSSLKSRVSSR